MSSIRPTICTPEDDASKHMHGLIAAGLLPSAVVLVVDASSGGVCLMSCWWGWLLCGGAAVCVVHDVDQAIDDEQACANGVHHVSAADPQHW